MLHLLDEALESFLRSEVPLAAREVTVSFEAPDEDWSSRVRRPTVNLFLWDIRTNLEERHAGTELVEGPDGKKYRRPPKPRVDCRYLVTAWTSALKDEHQLLGSVLATLLATRDLTSDYLPEAYASVTPLPTLTVAVPDGRDNSDFWAALGGQLKPGLDLTVTATVDLEVAREAGPPVEKYDLTIVDKEAPERTSRVGAVGGRVDRFDDSTTVRTTRGGAAVDEHGRYLVRGDESDEVIVEGAPASPKPARARSRDAKTTRRKRR
ncbi:MAG: DUF4255 domain-containing protein [Actinomycetota bacterium]|nr:DUF4255 domain-containing protein [Actinomycetota bacterium]